MKIQLKLLSDTLPGAGAGEAGGIDHEVVSGPNGFPYIPGRRIKGCLREAALELAEALALAGYETIWNESLLNQLFGRTGQQYAGWLRIANARLVEETELADWLKWLLEQNNFAAEAPAYFGSQAVLNNYTIIRAQTRISRATGGPVVNTLRTGRALRSGLVFTAQVDLNPAGCGLPRRRTTCGPLPNPPTRPGSGLCCLATDGTFS